MKNYYYFLSLPENASEEEIKKAYRKLSLKYHPDKNENDDFFAARFREAQEAYKILMDKEKRRIYDDNLGHQQRTNRPNLPPSIKTFSANKIHAVKGEEIIITWQTNQADIVKILPFGLEKSYGERAFKITEFKDGKFQLLLHATNSLLNKTVVRAITITEVFENDKEKFRNEVEELFKTQQPTRTNPHGQPKFLRIFLAILFLVIAILLLVKNFSE
ncbi:molecular chaperone DnaJ [Kaistella haifensis DSM 19056]|uniref:Molecular chaperone DnaJ n=1 Tax=Kaistella haifensis DSM 19056 TaxID=1450526 RepID=A0A246BBJ3_9FLAO|nr:J domain-containing protein [Kaistella haifensis]OWK98749.1 molecular chaperone DnaJ [Kaistella haifensis DSM 19056]